jgi:hypothetical protein
VAAFDNVTREQFFAAIATSAPSTVFETVLARIDHNMLFSDRPEANYLVLHEPLVLLENFSPPGFHTLIIGNLIVNGLVDLHYRDADEGGSFVIIGNVSCNAFANDYSKGTIIDGDLNARDFIVNAYEDSGLWVTKNLKTKFFFGKDVWAEVGGHVDMEYGDGYCLPIGYTNASEEAIRPRHDVETSLQLLDMDTQSLKPRQFVERLARGQSIFK